MLPFGVLVCTGKIKPIELNGCFLPYYREKPLVKRFPRHDCLYVLAFRSRNLLESTLGGEKPLFDQIVPIKDGLGLLNQIPPNLKLMLDLEFLSNGDARWLEIQPPVQEIPWPSTAQSEPGSQADT